MPRQTAAACGWRAWTYTELRSAILMRASLEGLHAELAAGRVADGEVAPAQLRRIVALADDAERAIDDGDDARAVLGNRAFHQAIDALANSPVSAGAVDRLWDRILVSTEQSLAPSGRGSAVNEEHGELLTALTAGDRESTGAIAVSHVRATLKRPTRKQGDRPHLHQRMQEAAMTVEVISPI